MTRSAALKRSPDDDKNSSDHGSLSEERIPKKRVRRKASLRTSTLIKAARPRATKHQSASPSTDTEEFKAKYRQLEKLNEGGCGCVFAGQRKADKLPVAIKRIPNKYIYCTHVDKDGKQISIEVAVMLKLAADSEAASPHISMLDWYQLDKELILVLERPMPAVDFNNYLIKKGGFLREEEAKVILRQLVDAAIDLKNKNIFHRDIKPENMLIETSSEVPRVRLIDFGLSSFNESDAFYETFYGTLITPEVFWNRSYRAEPTTVYQIGAVAFKAVDVEDVFNTVRLLRRHQKIPKFISKNCNDFIQTCLTVDADDRPTLEQLKIHPWLR
ncbi:pim proto-oncogene, serine/threonine kinase, related 128 [Pungitius pungitius]|uniref:pim proto-oncogene, serine/threonine kinase, related 128 n=1 Tax=Pungitius pungitius TaxID=134920 RepID=UPI002E12FF7D